MNRTHLLVTALGLALASFVPLPARAQAGHDHSGHDHSTHDHGKHEKSASVGVKVAPDAKAEAPAVDPKAAVIAAQLPTYPLETCVVSGEKLGSMGDPMNYVHEGRLVRFCCPMCEGGFLKDPAAHLAKIDAAVIERQLPSYPLGVCPVSGKELGSMGEAYDHVYGTRLVRFCCAGCVDTFEADPAAYLAKIDAAKVEETVADE